MKSTGRNPFQVFRDQWAIMSLYERFEQVVAITLSGVIAVVIVISLIQLIRLVFTLLVMDALNSLDHKVFQLVFGATMTLLIAMEFKHSIVKVALRKESIIQVKTIILIAILALARKFIILEPDVDPAKVAALAGTVLALGLTYLSGPGRLRGTFMKSSGFSAYHLFMASMGGTCPRAFWGMW